jgi:Dyp-type peroxidase family
VLTSYSLVERDNRNKTIEQLYNEKRKQRGIEFPKPGQQPHLLIVRLDLTSPPPFPSPPSLQFSSPSSSLRKSKDTLRNEVQKGLKRLCRLFEQIDTGKKTIDKLDKEGKLIRVALRDFKFSATIGFGMGFFDKLSIPDDKRPKKMKSMPDHFGLGDVTPYSLAQTDLIIQLGSCSDFVNRWIFENKAESQKEGDDDKSKLNKNKVKQEGEEEEDTADIVTAVAGWATITDIHAGFQRMDGRNLMGFNDGVSNPRPGSGDKFDSVVWTTEKDEGPILKDGTYMVFQKIEHDLDQWRGLSAEEQEEWVGRNKFTGLLLGTPENDDKKFIEALKKDDLKAKEKLRQLLNDQSDPERPFYDSEKFKNSVPAWSHVRKANPRQEKLPNGKRIEKKLIFRRGYIFTETGLNNRAISGLLFVSFQRDIENSFEFIKKNWLNNKNFPSEEQRPFTKHELSERHSQGRFSLREIEQIRFDLLKKQLLGLDDEYVLKDKLEEIKDRNTQNTGKEGLSGPSELGVIPTGQFLTIIPFGGGYYFVPPIPNRSIADIGQQFF